jgi:dienelactone hydrolase
LRGRFHEHAGAHAGCERCHWRGCRPFRPLLKTAFHKFGDVFSIPSCRRKPASRCEEARNRKWIPAFAGMTEYVAAIAMGSSKSHAEVRVPRRPGLLVCLLLAVLCGCARLGNLGPGLRGTLAWDAKELAADDPAAPGPHPVVAEGLEADGIDVALFRPGDLTTPAPAVVFLPALLTSEDQYESYARTLASRGFVVVVRGRYGLCESNPQLARDAMVLGNWLVLQGLADPAHIAVGGHSMGGKDAILAALDDPLFSAVFALDPDDAGKPSVARGNIDRLAIPLLLVGAEDAWRGWRICAPRDRNYQRFFERAPVDTVEVTLLHADHVQLLDDPDAFGQCICRVGTADSQQVRILARRATVMFLANHLQGMSGWSLKSHPSLLGEGACVRVKQAPIVPAGAACEEPS